MFLVIFLYICFTVNMFLESFIMSSNPYPLPILGLRFFTAGIVLFVAYIFNHKRFPYHQLQQLMTLSFLKYVAVLYVVSALSGAWSIQFLDPVKTCFIFVLSPFMTALMLYFWYNEKLSYKKIAGLSIGFSAIIPIILASTPGQINHVSWGLSMIAYAVFTSGIALFAYGWILHKNLSKTMKISPLLFSGVSLIVGGVINLLLAVIFYGQNMQSLELSQCFVWQILGFATLTALSYGLYSLALQQYSVTFVSFASFTEPAFAMLFAFLFFGESISLISIAALVALGFGLYLFYQEELIAVEK